MPVPPRPASATPVSATPTSAALIQTAEALARDVLLPAAADVDAGVRGPELDALAAAGLYGLPVPREQCGLGADAPTTARVVEILAASCLTTAFVWIQHLGVVKRAAAAGAPQLPAMVAGDLRAGVAVGGARPGRPAPLRSTPRGEGWVLRGEVPWISGWGMVDVILTAARGDADDVLWLLMDAPPLAASPSGTLRTSDPTVTLCRVDLVAADASNSAAAVFDGHVVPGARLLARQTPTEWQAADDAGLRLNGSLSLGLAGRCAVLTGSAALADAVDRVRDRLDQAATSELPAARAAAATLAWDAAALLAITTGGRAVAAGSEPERLARAALLMQVFGTRPSITTAHGTMLRDRFGV